MKEIFSNKIDEYVDFEDAEKKVDRLCFKVTNDFNSFASSTIFWEVDMEFVKKP